MAESRSLPGEGVVGGMVNGQEGEEGGITKGSEQSLGSDRYVYYSEFHVGFMGTYICQILSNCTFKYVVYCLSTASEKLCFSKKEMGRDDIKVQ